MTRKALRDQIYRIAQTLASDSKDQATRVAEVSFHLGTLHKTIEVEAITEDDAPKGDAVNPR